MFIVPRLMTPLWQKQILKYSDIFLELKLGHSLVLRYALTYNNFCLLLLSVTHSMRVYTLYRPIGFGKVSAGTLVK